MWIKFQFVHFNTLLVAVSRQSWCYLYLYLWNIESRRRLAASDETQDSDRKFFRFIHIAISSDSLYAGIFSQLRLSSLLATHCKLILLGMLVRLDTNCKAVERATESVSTEAPFSFWLFFFLSFWFFNAAFGRLALLPYSNQRSIIRKIVGGIGLAVNHILRFYDFPQCVKNSWIDSHTFFSFFFLSVPFFIILGKGNEMKENLLSTFW